MEQKTFSIPSTLFIIKKFVAIRLAVPRKLSFRVYGQVACTRVHEGWIVGQKSERGAKLVCESAASMTKVSESMKGD